MYKNLNLKDLAKLTIGAYYLHENGSLIFKPVSVFASDPNYFEGSFVKHVWLIFIEPPHPTQVGQLKWLFSEFLGQAFSLGAKETEIARIVKATKESDQYKEVLNNISENDIISAIKTNTVNELLERVS